ncbi:Uncharacterised protein [Streptococcus suis]|uniref:Transposase n=1 Tax=Streptococcus suis TaxID=1307 RepID=A0AB33U7Y2_STRSU|nr:hypothetical protein [Streptococcus suis]NQG21876.1 hypothetical protein [Streptococcus suis]NQP43943.1 hypothetical protein [Streptococcus suis]NQS05452.1 hypothetical protein [Streptococcus suis]CYU54360.1 Uncharacterised protein [Streptococcus suis]CYW75387.1 Uncharacterised protein [Streptococcus suis]
MGPRRREASGADFENTIPAHHQQSFIEDVGYRNASLLANVDLVPF